MCKDILKKIYKTAEKCGTDQIEVITNHLKFTGTICQEDCKDIDDGLLTLTDAKMRRIEDICTCTEPDCKCNEANFCALPYLHINLSKVVAFSLIKE